jgi:hypothetical protein
MFKLPNKEHQEILLGHYKNVKAESKKVRKKLTFRPFPSETSRSRAHEKCLPSAQKA